MLYYVNTLLIVLISHFLSIKNDRVTPIHSRSYVDWRNVETSH